MSPDDLLDFSANINPMGLPSAAAARLARDARDARSWSRYPDPENGDLRTAIACYTGLPGERIIIGAGADALIHVTIRSLAPRRCLVRIPAFCEYERAARAAGTETCFAASEEGLLAIAGPGDLAVLNNPHNPTGACLGRGEMLSLIAGLRKKGAVILIDEAFIDYVPGASVADQAVLREAVVVVRSLTKFFGCPGLRAGYAVAARETGQKLASELPPWPVTTMAANALAEALSDGHYREAALNRNEVARTKLSESLTRAGCQVYRSTANFILLRLPETFDAREVRDWLVCKYRILVRSCEDFGGLDGARHLRVAVRTEQENALLVAALEGIFAEVRCQKSGL